MPNFYRKHENNEMNDNTFNEEKQNTAIDLIITLVVKELSEESGRNPSEILPEFLASKTGRLLCDGNSKLWWSGPSDIAEQYKSEQIGIKSERNSSL